MIKELYLSSSSSRTGSSSTHFFSQLATGVRIFTVATSWTLGKTNQYQWLVCGTCLVPARKFKLVGCVPIVLTRSPSWLVVSCECLRTVKGMSLEHCPLSQCQQSNPEASKQKARRQHMRHPAGRPFRMGSAPPLPAPGVNSPRQRQASKRQKGKSCGTWPSRVVPTAVLPGLDRSTTRARPCAVLPGLDRAYLAVRIGSGDPR